MFTAIIAFGQDGKYYTGMVPIKTGYDYVNEEAYISSNVNTQIDEYWKILQRNSEKNIKVSGSYPWTTRFSRLANSVNKESKFNWLQESANTTGSLSYRINFCVEGVEDEVKLGGVFGCDNRFVGIKIDGVEIYRDQSIEYRTDDDKWLPKYCNYNNPGCGSTIDVKNWCIPGTHIDDNTPDHQRRCYGYGNEQFKCFIKFDEIYINPDLLSDGAHTLEFIIHNEGDIVGLALDFELTGVKKAWVIPKGGSSDIGRCTPKGVIRGIAFKDKVNCHKHDDNEGPEPNKLILLYNSSGDLLKETRTNSYGFFSFENLDATQSYEVAYGVNGDDILTFPYDDDAKALKKEIVTPQRFRDDEFLVVDLKFGFINDEECSSYDMILNPFCKSMVYGISSQRFSPTTTYKWDFGDGTTKLHRSGDTYPSYPYSENGNYDVNVTINSSCWCDEEIVLTKNIDIDGCGWIEGRVFDDKNNCGAFDQGEEAEGKIIELYNASGQLLMQRLTSAQGYYSFPQYLIKTSETYKVVWGSSQKLSFPSNSSFYLITPETFESQNNHVKNINFGFLSDDECNINYDLDFSSTCVDNAASFDIKNAASQTDYLNSSNTYSWDFGDGNTSSQQSGNHQYTDVGSYNVSVTVENSCACDNTVTLTKQIEIEDCPDCEECVSSFAPLQSKEYVVSCWVSAENPDGKTHFNDVALVVSFENSDYVKEFYPTGQVIDGWQRIEGIVTVPGSATKLHLELQNNSQEGFYLDDVRMSPKNSSFVTYVYDPLTLRLVAELDEHNYATIYEYDEEGALIRVKKETERGVQTIQESRNNMRRK